ncbi:MAG: hypothetical protein KGQ16_04940 [Cyanobacteria bacterium REEB444]|nr:hypothetical protein [Cyanobacteria bacterium REEB444]
MPSILLSFVGNQDPFSKNHTEGSIISLVRHLTAQNHPIIRAILLHTSDTASNAQETQDWLESELTLPPQAIALLPVTPEFSADPIDLLLASQEARRAIQIALTVLDATTTLELNASSGTPAMKAAWSIMQAAGYAPHGRIWQVRNPQEIRPGQDRVFANNVNILKREFDLKVIQQQVQDYNYRGALITLQQAGLITPTLEALLNYGFYRLAFDFNRAFSSLQGCQEAIDPEWQQQIAPLRQGDRRALLKEAYFKALIQLQHHQYGDFLVSLFRLHENILQFLLVEKIGLDISGRLEREQSWQVIRQVDQGRLYQHLQQYTLPRGGALRLGEGISRYVNLAIVEYYPQFAPVEVVQSLKVLNEYREQRNKSVHDLVGVSEIENQEMLMTHLNRVMRQVVGGTMENPLLRLNQYICDRL